MWTDGSQFDDRPAARLDGRRMRLRPGMAQRFWGGLWVLGCAWLALVAYRMTPSLAAAPAPLASQTLASRSSSAADAASQPGRARFIALNVFVNTGDQPLAAYQFELRVTRGDARIVGIEGGASAAFKEPPYYDPAALQQQRIIVAAFNTGTDLPRGRTRVARLMMQVRSAAEEPVDYTAKLMVATDQEGRTIPATIEIGQGENP